MAELVANILVGCLLFASGVFIKPDVWAQKPPSDTDDLPAYREYDTLARPDFAKADEALLSIRVYDREGKPIIGLPSSAFRVRVNGIQRDASQETSTDSPALLVPLVLIVFPPNQQVIHEQEARQALKHFNVLNADLHWKVALLDADGTTTDYTQKRDQLLAQLDAIAHKNEPFVHSTSGGRLGSSRGSGAWLNKAEEAIMRMQVYQGPKIILAFNRTENGNAEEGRKLLSSAGPESLVNAAIGVGAHIYVANISGPGVVVPGGDASTGERPEQVGPIPYDLQVRTQFAELQHFVYRASLAQITAQATAGGLANSVEELARQIDRDVGANYILRIPLTALDRDKGQPAIEVQVSLPQTRAVLIDVFPLEANMEERVALQSRLAEIWRATAVPITSKSFRINQRVDYFPVRGGTRPILPMRAEVVWLGESRPLDTIYVAEYVQNSELDIPVLRKEMETELVGRSLDWERDGKLAPGKYDWRIVVHDKTGAVLASADQRIAVGMPENADVQASTLLVGRDCTPNQSSDGLRRRKDDQNGRHRNSGSLTDPLRLNDCRVKPSASGAFLAGQNAWMLVRIYPAGKAGKEPPEQWSVVFSIQNQFGSVELTKASNFRVDTGGGYSAAVAVPLTLAGNKIATADVHGPGLKHGLMLHRPLVVAGQIPD